MDPCCAKEMSDRRKTAALLRELRLADPTRRAEALRRGVVLVDARGQIEQASSLFKGQPEVAVDRASEDSDTGYISSNVDDSEIDDEEAEVIERMRMARLRDVQGALLEVGDDFRLAVLERHPVVVVHAYNPDRRATSRLDDALQAVAAENPDLTVCRSHRGAAIADIILQTDRIPPERVRNGSLALFKQASLVALADVSTFATDDDVALDALNQWLDRAGAFDAQFDATFQNQDDPLFDDDDDPATYYSCGRPGCTKPFQHHHIGPSAENVPLDWDIDRLAELPT